MTRCLPCETARELLEPFVDRELSTGDQVAVELHLRSCRTCATRVDDLSLIGWSLRAGPPSVKVADEVASTLGVAASGVLARVRAERAQSWRARMPDLLSDMRFWWPAMGATAAVIACLLGTATVWRIVTTEKRPHSLAWLIDGLENPGSDRNPMRLDGRMSVPRVLDSALIPEEMAFEDASFTVAFVVTQAGGVGGVQLVPGLTVVSPKAAAAAQAIDRQAVLDAVRASRFAPAQSADGRPVAVRVVLLLERTTIREAGAESSAAQWVRRAPASKAVLPPLPADSRSSADSLASPSA